VRERDFISTIRNRFNHRSELLIKGIGDDCAVFTGDGDLCWLATTDLLVEDVHFVRKWHDPYLLGRKSVAVNISDIAAMGARPRLALLSIALPPSLSSSWLDRWQHGVDSMLGDHGCMLMGGDTTRSSVLTINVMVLGTSPAEKVLYRSGAKAGDDIYVSGPLGTSAAGFELLSKGVQEDALTEKFMRAHLDPQPQVALGLALSASGFVTAMQDISDGIATDISHICGESGVGAEIEAEKLPREEDFDTLCSSYDLSGQNLMISGGEDYELVFTAACAKRRAIEAIGLALGKSLTRIGSVLAEQGRVYLRQGDGKKDITFGGFEHAP